MDTCKICGAPRDPLNANCKFCGTAYQLSNVTGETYIAALRTILTRIDEAERSGTGGQQIVSLLTRAGGANAKVTAISTFALPSDVENLLQFLAFCHGNAQVIIEFGDRGGERVQGAWHGKAKMAFGQLKMKAIGNPALAPYITEYERLYGVNARAPIPRRFMALGLVVLIMLLVLCVRSCK
jgi:hypothetical protein